MIMIPSRELFFIDVAFPGEASYPLQVIDFNNNPFESIEEIVDRLYRPPIQENLNVDIIYREITR